VAVELGATSREQLTDAQLEYVDKIKEKLVKVRLRCCLQESPRQQHCTHFVTHTASLNQLIELRWPLNPQLGQTSTCVEPHSNCSTVKVVTV
jgi:hypothetical protein